MKTAPTRAARRTLLLAIAVWALLSAIPNPRPDPAPATAPAGDFSAERAMVHVAAIAQRPHPMGSLEHRRVRDYIRTELGRLNLEAQIQTGTGHYSRGRFENSGTVENVLARLAGTANTRPVMLVAHYDSTLRGPGAGDDAHGVAVLLETLRALRASPSLRNDTIFLFTDGEEGGLLGADVFMRMHPWRSEPGVVLNFDARGTGGPSFMFETSAGNAWLIDALRTAAPRVEATSTAYEIYRLMPNDTDLSVFKRAGLNGMNFAFIGGDQFYHGPLDDVAHLDRRSVQEEGDYALGLARIFGDQDLTQPHSGNAIYFPTLLTPLIAYPEPWAGPLAWLATAGLAAALWFGRRTRGRWIAAALAPLAAISIYICRTAPGASYLLEWPLIAGVASFALLVTAPKQLVVGWRLTLLALLPAAVLLIVVPFALPVVKASRAVGTAIAAPILALAALVILAGLAPQIVLVLRKGEARPQRAAV